MIEPMCVIPVHSGYMLLQREAPMTMPLERLFVLTLLLCGLRLAGERLASTSASLSGGLQRVKVREDGLGCGAKLEKVVQQL